MELKPIVYTKEVKVVQADLDELNHVNNVVYFKYLQEVAIEHWYSAAPQAIIDSTRWVVKKHEIEYFLPAFINEVLTIRTYIAKFNGVYCERIYEIHKPAGLVVKASTLWVGLDAQSLKPKRVQASDVEPYFFA
jgi:acyl-CoA thioester hydrolase